jgi:hypothetical protein
LPSLYNLGSDRRENTASTISSVIKLSHCVRISMYFSVYLLEHGPLIPAAIDMHAAAEEFWTRHVLYGPCRLIRWQNFLFFIFSCSTFFPVLFLLSYRPWLRRLVADFPPRRPGIEPESSHAGFVLDKAALVKVLYEYFGFPCQSFSPPSAPQSSPSIIQGWYNRPISGVSNSVLGFTPVQ